MKKIIGVVIASMMFANIGYARDVREIDDYHSAQLTQYIRTVCVDGYKFVVSYNSSQMISTVQFFERAGGVSLPAKC